MNMIYTSITQLIGSTPIIELVNYERIHSLKAKILAKLEYFNPTGSVKDRTARAMIEDAENRKLLKTGMTIVEPTSGNTGIALAAIGAAKGYRVILTMPETMSRERRVLIASYGAEIILTDGKAGMRGAVEKAEEIAEQVGGIILGQFKNPANPETHRATTGAEIWADTFGKVDIFVAGVGTGGTLTGAGRYLKSRNADVKVIAVEPAESPVLSGGKAGAHKIQGIGAGFVPEIFDPEICDEVITVDGGAAKIVAEQACKTDGIFAGISSGAALFAAVKLANRPENYYKNIAVIFPDSGDRYLT